MAMHGSAWGCACSRMHQPRAPQPPPAAAQFTVFTTSKLLQDGLYPVTLAFSEDYPVTPPICS